MHIQSPNHKEKFLISVMLFYVFFLIIISGLPLMHLNWKILYSANLIAGSLVIPLLHLCEKLPCVSSISTKGLHKECYILLALIIPVQQVYVEWSMLSLTFF